MIKLPLLLSIIAFYPLRSEVIHDPVADIMTLGEYSPGRSYYKLVVDINHDGRKDVLLGLKETPTEIEEAKKTAGKFSPDYNPDGSCPD